MGRPTRTASGVCRGHWRELRPVRWEEGVPVERSEGAGEIRGAARAGHRQLDAKTNKIAVQSITAAKKRTTEPRTTGATNCSPCSPCPGVASIVYGFLKSLRVLPAESDDQAGCRRVRAACLAIDSTMPCRRPVPHSQSCSMSPSGLTAGAACRRRRRVSVLRCARIGYADSRFTGRSTSCRPDSEPRRRALLGRDGPIRQRGGASVCVRRASGHRSPAASRRERLADAELRDGFGDIELGFATNVSAAVFTAF